MQTEEKQKHLYYNDDLINILQAVYGEGYLSPGGLQEVSRILGGLDLAGCHVLDIGCGLGGPAIELARTFGAAKVTSIDVNLLQVVRAKQNVNRSGLKDRVVPMFVNTLPMPFEEDHFDIVFSKEALNETTNKLETFDEIFRVLKPGGWFTASDWLTGSNSVSQEFQEWTRTTWPLFSLESQQGTQALLEKAGFENITITNRNNWYRQIAADEMQYIRADQQVHPMFTSGAVELEEFVELWDQMITHLDSGELLPAHIRAQKSPIGYTGASRYKFISQRSSHVLE